MYAAQPFNGTTGRRGRGAVESGGFYLFLFVFATAATVIAVAVADDVVGTFAFAA